MYPLSCEGGTQNTSSKKQGSGGWGGTELISQKFCWKLVLTFFRMLEARGSAQNDTILLPNKCTAKTSDYINRGTLAQTSGLKVKNDVRSVYIKYEQYSCLFAEMDSISNYLHSL